MTDGRTHLWFAAANGVWLAGGLLAYATRASLALATAVALVPALPALLESRLFAPRKWMDRALAAALGTWAVMAVFIITPYMATEEGISLWTSRGFAGLSLTAASLGMLVWNATTFRMMGGDARTAWTYAAFHLATLAAAVYLVAGGDGGRHDVILRGETYPVVDLRLAPAVAAMAAIPWGAAFVRGPPVAAAPTA